jgi:hypothetical protein
VTKRVRIGSGSAYWGDMFEPAVALAERGEVSYIGFDFLAELTMSIFQRAKAKDPETGYIPDLLTLLRLILPTAREHGVKLILNGGAANPAAAGRVVAALATELGQKGLRIGTVSGDDILGQLDDLVANGWVFENLDTGERGLDHVRGDIVAAHAYIGSEGIVGALADGADVVITGRVADSALYVAPLMHEFGWTFEDPDWDRIGAAITLGHLVECAECVTGGMSNVWESARCPWDIGFPILDVTDGSDGVSAVLEKTPGSGGIVNQWTVKEHLLYETHDPASYLMPDGIGDFTTLQIEELGDDRVRLTGMSGRARPETLKAQIGYRNGWIGEGQVVFSWPDAPGKARRGIEFLQHRFAQAGIDPLALEMRFLGVDALHGDVAPPMPTDPDELCLRVAARTRTREEADIVRREVTHLWTVGGLGTAFGTPSPPRPVIGLWPTLVPRAAVHASWNVEEVH